MSRVTRYRDDQIGRHDRHNEVEPQRESKGVAPGKITSTASLPERDAAMPRPVQRKSEPASECAPAPASGPVEDWTDVVVRPDLYRKPVLRKSASEVGMLTPPSPASGPVEDWTDVVVRPDLYRKPVLRKSASEVGTLTPPSSADGSRSGQPLDSGLRSAMERSFATSFDDVRVHRDDLAGKRGAQAVTHGSDIHFAPGAYAPDSTSGRFLVGHELAHVVQQRAGGGQRTQDKSASGSPALADSGLEAEADTVGARAAAGLSVAGLVHGRVADGPSVTQHYEAPEHEDLGNAGPYMSVKLKNGMTLTYGQMSALIGDFYTSHEQLDVADPAELKEILAIIKSQRKDGGGVETKDVEFERATAWREQPVYNARGKQVGKGGEYKKGAAHKNKVKDAARRETKSFFGLASSNHSHFAGEHTQTWTKQHQEALELAAKSHAAMQAGDKAKAEEFKRQAIMVQAGGAHFLQDSFCSGHAIEHHPVSAWMKERWLNDPDFKEKAILKLKEAPTRTTGLLPTP